MQLVRHGTFTTTLAVLMSVGFAVAALATPYEDAYRQGTSLLEKKDFPGALAAFTKAITLNSKSAAAYYSRAEASFALGKYQQTISDCNRVIAIHPKFGQAYYWNMSIAQPLLPCWEKTQK